MENDTIRRNIETLSDSFETQAELYFGTLETASRNRVAAVVQEMSEETENTADNGSVRKQIRENIIDINGKMDKNKEKFCTSDPIVSMMGEVQQDGQSDPNS